MCVARAQGTPCLAREQLLGDPKEAGAAQLPEKPGKEVPLAPSPPAWPLEYLCFRWSSAPRLIFHGEQKPLLWALHPQKKEIYAPFHGSGPPTEEISTLWMRSAGNAAGIIKDTCRWEKPFSHRSKPNFC